jgi:hypothetical protein
MTRLANNVCPGKKQSSQGDTQVANGALSIDAERRSGTTTRDSRRRIGFQTCHFVTNGVKLVRFGNLTYFRLAPTVAVRVLSATLRVVERSAPSRRNRRARTSSGPWHNQWRQCRSARVRPAVHAPPTHRGASGAEKLSRNENFE